MWQPDILQVASPGTPLWPGSGPVEWARIKTGSTARITTDLAMKIVRFRSILSIAPVTTNPLSTDSTRKSMASQAYTVGQGGVPAKDSVRNLRVCSGAVQTNKLKHVPHEQLTLMPLYPAGIAEHGIFDRQVHGVVHGVVHLPEADYQHNFHYLLRREMPREAGAQIVGYRSRIAAGFADELHGHCFPLVAGAGGIEGL